MGGMSRVKGFTCLGLLLLLSACAQPKQLYNYGDYSNSYYKYKKQATPENRQALIASIEKAVDESEKGQSGRVPPGIFANLGYMYLQDGNSQKAISLFEKEKANYPESTHFMERIIAKIEKVDEKEEQQ